MTFPYRRKNTQMMFKKPIQLRGKHCQKKNDGVYGILKKKNLFFYSFEKSSFGEGVWKKVVGGGDVPRSNNSLGTTLLFLPPPPFYL